MTEAPPQISAERKERFERVDFAFNSLEARYHPNQNENAVLVDKNLGLAILCDGIGSYDKGHEAAQTAVREVYTTINEWEEQNDEPAVRGKHDDMTAVVLSVK